MQARANRLLSSLRSDESGQGLIEYALLAMMIAFGAITTMHGLASDINSAFTTFGSKLDSAVGFNPGSQGGGDQGGQGGGGNGGQYGQGGRCGPGGQCGQGGGDGHGRHGHGHGHHGGGQRHRRVGRGGGG